MKKFMNWRNTAGRYALLFILLILLSLAGFFVAAWQHHSESLDMASMPSACAIVIEQIHYSTTTPETDDCKIRRWYADNVREIPDMLRQMQEQAMPVRDQAMCAFGIRHQLRMAARDAMASAFEKTLLRMRDALAYRHFDGPGFSQLAGLHPEESDYRRILASAAKTDAVVNDICEQ